MSSIKRRLEKLEEQAGGQPALDVQARYQELRKLPTDELMRLYREALAESAPTAPLVPSGLPPDELVRRYRELCRQDPWRDTR